MPELLAAGVRELLADYLGTPEDYWDSGRGGRFQVTKIVRGMAAIGEREGLTAAETLDRVLHGARERASGHPPTVYVGGRGSSGSHWLAAMLHHLGPFVDAGEVAFPAPLRRRMREFGHAQQALVVDAIHLVHALPGREDAAGQSIVNSRGTVHYLPFKRWEPECVFVHLLRDPREQCISVTYRKHKAREIYPAGDDDDFLRLMVYLNRASLLRVLGSPVPPDYVTRYEDLRADPQAVLVDLLRLAGRQADPTTLARVAFEHRAETIQSGLAPNRANLYRGSRHGWRETATLRERQILHAGLSDVLDITRYPADDCLGVRFEPMFVERELRFDLPTGVLLGELQIRSAEMENWKPTGPAAGTVRIPAGVELRLRCPGGWTSGLSNLAAIPAGTLTSLCLAGNQDIIDDDLVHLRGQHALRELDLARTPITDDGLGHLDSLAEIRGLNLLGSRVTDSAATGFATRRPDCTIAAGSLWSDEWRGKWLEDQFIP